MCFVIEYSESSHYIKCELLDRCMKYANYILFYVGAKEPVLHELIVLLCGQKHITSK